MFEGTIQQAEGGRILRVNVRLLSVADGEQIWAEKFDGETAKIFGLEDRLSESAAQALGFKSGGAGITNI